MLSGDTIEVNLSSANDSAIYSVMRDREINNVLGTVEQRGSISTANTNGVGGKVTLLGDQIGLFENSIIDVSGTQGAGTVLIGGNWQGQGTEPHASAVYMDSLANIKADATYNGNGGQVVLWSEDYTGFYGAISAKGGIHGGDGGQIETSSHYNLQASGLVDTSALLGKAGHWLLDPVDVTIVNSAGIASITSPYSPSSNSSVNVSAIAAALASGSVTIQTAGGTGGNGDIIFSDTSVGTLTYNTSLSTTPTLTLKADRSIVMHPGWRIVPAAGSGALNIDMQAALTSFGTIDIGGPPNTTGSTATALNSNGGNISLNNTTNGADSTSGIRIRYASFQADAGNITITGLSAGIYGIRLYAGTNTFSTTSGNISLSGTSLANSGLMNDGASANISSNSGAITLHGLTSNSTSAAIDSTATWNIGWTGSGNGTSGNITIRGQDAGSNAGMNLSSLRVKTNGGTLTIGAIPFSAGVAGTSASSGLGLGSFTVPSTLIANGSVVSNLSIGGVNNYGTITMNQVIGNGTLNSGVCSGTGTFNCLTGSATIQAGGMYASGTNTIASPATLSAKADGNITIAANITKTAGGDANLMLSAGKTVQINSGINLTSTVGKFNTIIEAATTITDGNVRFVGSNTVNTNGGDITVSAGSNLLRGAVWFHSGSLISSGGNITLQNGSAGSIASFNRSIGVDLEGGAITVDARAPSGGGTITLLGTGALSGTITHSIGLDVENAIIQTNGSGALNITGISGTVAPGSNVGAALYLDGGVTFATESGPINLSGKLQSSGGTGNSAIYASSGTTKIYSTGNAGQADISIRGEVTTGSGQALKFESGAPTYIGWDNASNVTSGNITIQGQDTGTNAGMTLTGVRIRTNGGTLTVGAIPFSAGVAGTSASSGLGLGSFTLSNGFIANGTVLSNLSIGGVNNYGTITMNQVLGCATPTACGGTGVSLGNGTTIPTFPVTIQAGGMYASGTNTIASPAVLSANTNGGNVTLGGSITTANRAINILAGSAVVDSNNIASSARGSVTLSASTSLTSGGGMITLANGGAGGVSNNNGISLGTSTILNAIGGGAILLRGTSNGSGHGISSSGTATNTVRLYSDTGDVSLIGVALGTGAAISIPTANSTYIGWDNGSQVTTGNILLQGQDSGANAGMNLTGARIRTNGGTLTVGAIPFSAGIAGTSASSGLGLGSFTLSNGFIANGTVLSNLSIGGLNNYGTITMNQVLGCTTPTACGATGVSLGNGTTIPTFPVTIQAGGMYASGTNTIASPAVLSAITNGGNLSIGGSITTNNQAINILAGGAVPIISGGSVYSVSTGSVFINI